jgi:FkbM family methyltransferase
MLMNFDSIIKSGLNIKGVLHIGAHFGQEVTSYRSHGLKSVLFEPHPNTFSILKEKWGSDSSVVLVNKALGSTQCTSTMFCETANQGMSSSLLKPKKHLEKYPHIKFESTIEVEQTTLDLFADSFPSIVDYNFINMDVQGYELEVLKGATKTLANIDHIICEVNWEELYENCVQIGDLDRFLFDFGFKRIAIAPTNYGWGDALYSKGNMV